MGGCCTTCNSSGVTINGVTYHVIKEIGEGAFSFVQLVKKTNVKYALKRVLIQIPEYEEMIEREVKAHNTIKHKFVMPLVDHEIVKSKKNKEARLLFPYYNLGSVQEMIEVAEITKHKIGEKEIVQMVKCLCEAVSAFHSNNPPYAHRDIKPHNLLIMEKSNIMLMDLGSVREARVQIKSRKEAMELQELCAQECTAAYRAPELFEVPSECTITEKSDIWSIGCTMHALAYGESPCDGSATSAMSPLLRLDNQKYSEEFNFVILKILQEDPEKRPSTREIIKLLNDLHAES